MNKQKFVGIALALAALIIVFVTEQVLQPTYFLKSAIKAVAFMGAILLYCKLMHQKFTDVISLHKVKNIKPILVYMLCFLVGTAVIFFAFKNYIDLQSIKQNLIAKENLTKGNCLFVFLYIIVCNSFLEESFFRGFVSGVLDNKRIGYVISAVLFSLYHIGIFITWFNPFIFALCIAGLTAVGLFLQWLVQKYESILASYITHACANIAINIVGALLIFELI